MLIRILSDSTNYSTRTEEIAMVDMSLTNLSTSSRTVYANLKKHVDFRTGPTMIMGFIQMLYESHNGG